MIRKLLICLCITDSLALNTGYFWFINDFHYDPTYWTTQESCNDQIAASELGRYGNYECDSSLQLVKSSLAATKKHGASPDFIMWAGDNPPHPKDKNYLNKEKVLEIVRNMTFLVKETWPNVPVYATMGNHDYYPTSQLPAEGNDIYDEIAELWADWLTNTETNATGTFKRYASYVVPFPKAGFKMVVVNTNIYYKLDKVTKNSTDPGGQFKWLEGILKQARDNQEKVHILTHIPSGTMGSSPGVHWFNEDHNTRFNGIIRDYSDVILATYGVHQHTDTFHLFYKGDTPVATQIIVPSVTPWKARITDTLRGEARNPGVRKFTYNSDTMELLHFHQYYLDIPVARHNDTDQWKLLYSTTSAFGIDNLSPQSLHQLVNTFDEHANEKFHNYHYYNSVGAYGESGNQACDAKCKKDHICSIRHVDYKDYDECRKEATTDSKANLVVLSLPLFVFLSLFNFDI